MFKELRVRTSSRVEMVKITRQVQDIISDSNSSDGICHVFIPHTTAGVTINEGADPDVVTDTIKELNKIVPFEDNYRHMEGNSAAHIKASVMGSSAAIIVKNGQLQLGTWQSIFFCEFDGPRSRKVWIQVS